MIAIFTAVGYMHERKTGKQKVKELKNFSNNSNRLRYFLLNLDDYIMKNKIRELRKQKKITQAQLAKVCHVSRQTINMIENDHYDPTLKLALELSENLEITVNELFQKE